MHLVCFSFPPGVPRADAGTGLTPSRNPPMKRDALATRPRQRMWASDCSGCHANSRLIPQPTLHCESRVVLRLWPHAILAGRGLDCSCSRLCGDGAPKSVVPVVVSSSHIASLSSSCDERATIRVCKQSCTPWHALAAHSSHILAQPPQNLFVGAIICRRYPAVAELVEGGCSVMTAWPASCCTPTSLQLPTASPVDCHHEQRGPRS